MRLMLVEDNAPVAEAVVAQIMAYFPEGSIHVEIAESPARAVYLAANNDFDLVLMDIGLTRTPMEFIEGRLDTLDPTPPGFDGNLTALAIRGLGWNAPDMAERAGVPIVAVTGGWKPMDPKLQMLAGFCETVLTKPVLGKDLRNAIEAHRRSN